MALLAKISLLWSGNSIRDNPPKYKRCSIPRVATTHKVSITFQITVILTQGRGTYGYMIYIVSNVEDGLFYILLVTGLLVSSFELIELLTISLCSWQSCKSKVKWRKHCSGLYPWQPILPSKNFCPWQYFFIGYGCMIVTMF